MPLHRPKRIVKTPFLRRACEFLRLFFDRSNIHGFFYFSLKFLSLAEKIFWLLLITSAFCATILLSLQSWNRYKTKGTVVAIERDHYYWNTSLPSLTICPTAKRIDRNYFDAYCQQRGIVGNDKTEFYEFVESMANATYETFHRIKNYSSVAKLNLQPDDYMTLIFNLTRDLSRIASYEQRVKSYRNQKVIRTEQILTEHGICYVANNFLALDLSAKLLITGEPLTPANRTFYGYREVIDVLAGNLFDGIVGYTMIGFEENYLTIYVHSPFETINIGKLSFYTNNALDFHTSAYEMIATKNFQTGTSIERRRCRFKSESNLTHYRTYTHRLCLQECRLNLVYQLCQCIPHFYPNRIDTPKRVCHYQELIDCVSQHTQFLIKFHGEREDDKPPIACYCQPNCIDSSVFIDSYLSLNDSTDLLGTIGAFMIMQSYPLIRYKRKKLFSRNDLFVSIGGTASFFTGFCVLGAIEIIYFFTLRLFWHLRGRTVSPMASNVQK